MKKTLALVAACALTAAAACGCASKTSAQEARPLPRSTPEITQKTPERTGVIEIDLGGIFDLAPQQLESAALTRRTFLRSPAGEYTVEYVHYPRGEERDDTLDYKLTLNDDNTYTLSVTTDGVNAEHSGRWYMHRDGNIVMYYDEPIDTPAHNVYVGDAMYAESLPQGKLMIYDKCNVIVLARQGENTSDYEITTDGGNRLARLYASSEG